MPTYTFRRKSTNEEWTTVISMAEREVLLADSDVEQLIVSAPSVGDSARLGLKKPDDWFKDRLKQIKKNNVSSNINTF